MIYLVGSAVTFTILLNMLISALRRRYQRRLAQEYLDGFRAGQLAEALANQASAPRIASVRVPLSGRN